MASTSKNTVDLSAVSDPGHDALSSQRDGFRALKLACGVSEACSRARIKLTGADRARWLNGMVTNNIRDLAAGHGVYAFLLNPQGHILADLYAYNRGEFLEIDTDLSLLEKILAIFDHYIIMDDVVVENVSEQSTTFTLAGPRAHTVMKAVGLLQQKLEPLEFLDQEWRGKRVTVIRIDNPAVESYQVWIAHTEADWLYRALLEAGAQAVHPEAWELLRIASGVPRYGQDIRERDLPQETEQQRALNFSKGCYIGQEIVERIRSRGSVHRTFTGFIVDGPLPPTGSKIQSEGKDVGEITSAALVPLEDGIIAAALGYIRREQIGPDRELICAGSSLRSAALPFPQIWST